MVSRKRIHALTNWSLTASFGFAPEINVTNLAVVSVRASKGLVTIRRLLAMVSMAVMQ